MSNSFLATNEGKQIIIFEEKGYKLAQTQHELTIPQELFLYHGWEWLNREKEKQMKRK